MEWRLGSGMNPGLDLVLPPLPGSPPCAPLFSDSHFPFSNPGSSNFGTAVSAGNRNTHWHFKGMCTHHMHEEVAPGCTSLPSSLE